jgi:hypothetical protein
VLGQRPDRVGSDEARQVSTRVDQGKTCRRTISTQKCTWNCPERPEESVDPDRYYAKKHVTFTDSGTLSGVQTASIAGSLVDETIEGTFTVNPDCTGSGTVNVFHGSTLARTSRINIVWDSHQNEARAIFLTPGTNISILARRMNEED